MSEFFESLILIAYCTSWKGQSNMFGRRKDPTGTFMGHLLVFALITPTEYPNGEILFLGDLLEKFNGELERKNEIFSQFNHRDVNFEYCLQITV